MNVAIIGAGFAGLSAAYDLGRMGHKVTIYEGASQVGGLASGFRAPGWDWALERFYHHIFTSDRSLIDFVKEIDADDLLFFRRPLTAFWCGQHGAHAFDGALPVLLYPHLPLIDKVRMGLVVLLLRRRRDWRRLEKTTADRWLRRAMGDRAYEALWKPMLVGKFGEHYREINMSWFWARIVARSPKLGYFRGGFQALAERMAERVRDQGGRILLSTPVQQITPCDGGLTVLGPEGPSDYEAVLATTSPALLRRLVPALPESYTARLERLRSMGAVVMTLALDRPLTNGVYWMNMNKERFPFLALVEHTNFIEPAHYGGQHLLYLGDYLDPGHEYFQLSQDELLKRFLPALRLVNPAFEPTWVHGAWLHREVYAQPIVPAGHSANIPPLQTPLPGLFWASMSQVYPWDRGTNFAVELGRRAAQEMLRTLAVGRAAPAPRLVSEAER